MHMNSYKYGEHDPESIYYGLYEDNNRSFVAGRIRPGDKMTFNRLMT